MCDDGARDDERRLPRAVQDHADAPIDGGGTPPATVAARRVHPDVTLLQPRAADPVPTGEEPPTPSDGSWTGHARNRLDAVVLLVVAVLGMTRLAFPFTGDQAMFTVGARAMRHGAVLYSGFWDIKQPGIYAFYLAAGTLGGFNEVSVHVVELVTLLGFSYVLQRAGRGLFRTAWVASVLPLFIVGLYYASARPWELSQLEALVGIPLFASVWLALRAVDARDGTRRGLLVASGAAAAIAALLKIVCLPLVGPAWIVAVVLMFRVDNGRGAKARLGRATTQLGWIALGVAAPLAAVAGYFAAHGLWHEVTWTYFTYTPKTTSIAGRPLSRLTDAVGRFGAVWAPVLLLGAIGAAHHVRRGWDRWSLAFAGWIVVGIPVFLTQHWWPYQLQMFLVPVGFFAARGTETLARSWRTLPRHIAAATVTVLFVSALPLAASAGKWTASTARHGFGVTAAQRVALHDAVDTQYRTGRELARFVQDHDPGRGPVYVLGNPIDLYLSGRAQAIPTNGWEAEQYDATLWRRIATGLDHARPHVLVVDDFSAQKARERSPETRDVVLRLYCPARRVAAETWYLRRAENACPTSLRPNI